MKVLQGGIEGRRRERERQSQIEMDFKALVHMIMKASKSKICSLIAGWRPRN